MPAWLFEFLANVVGLSENDVLDMTEDEAMQRYMRHIGATARSRRSHLCATPTVLCGRRIAAGDDAPFSVKSGVSNLCHSFGE